MTVDQSRREVESTILAAYDEMRRMAMAILGPQRRRHTLPPTALVHEAYLRIVDLELWEEFDRHAILAYATRAMRSVLVDYARRRSTTKRGGNATRIPLDEFGLAYESRGYDLVELDSTLNRLGDVDPQLAKIVEMRFFGGLSLDEIAAALRLSTRTVSRDWMVARAWLRSEYEGYRRDRRGI